MKRHLFHLVSVSVVVSRFHYNDLLPTCCGLVGQVTNKSATSWQLPRVRENLSNEYWLLPCVGRRSYYHVWVILPCVGHTTMCGLYYHVWVILPCVDHTTMCGSYYHVWMVLPCVDGITMCGSYWQSRQRTMMSLAMYGLNSSQSFIKCMCGSYYHVWVVLPCVDCITMCGSYYHVWIVLPCVDHTTMCGSYWQSRQRAMMSLAMYGLNNDTESDDFLSS